MNKNIKLVYYNIFAFPISYEFKNIIISEGFFRLIPFFWLMYNILMSLKQRIKDIYRSRYILWTMIVKDIKTRYTGSLFGPLWLAFVPLYQIMLYTFIFSFILKVRFEEGAGTFSFVVYLLAGLIPWIFFSEATNRGITTFIENAHLIKKIKFPPEICTLSVIGSSAITFGIYMFFYFIMLLVNGSFNIQTLPFFTIPLLIEVMIIIGLSLGLGSLAVFFRDIVQGLGMVLNLIFFLTPIVYPSGVIPSGLKWVFSINPFYYIVEIYRAILIKGNIPPLNLFYYPALFSVFVFISGYYLFNKTEEAFKDTL